MGMTHVRLAAANEDMLKGALHTAWNNRVQKNAKSRKNQAARSRAAVVDDGRLQPARDGRRSR